MANGELHPRWVMNEGPTMQVIFRKGGIREPAFRPKEHDFYLFPNSFHAEGALLKSDAAARFSKVIACHHGPEHGHANGWKKYVSPCAGAGF